MNHRVLRPPRPRRPHNVTRIAPADPVPLAVFLVAVLGVALAATAGSAILRPAPAAAADAWVVGQVSSGTHDNERPDLDDHGRYLVHEGVLDREGDSEVILHDLSNDDQTVLTHNNIADQGPRVDGGHVVWQSGDDFADMEIYLHEIGAHRTTRLTDNDVPDGGARISGNLVVWSGVSEEPRLNTEIYVHRISSGITTRLTTNDYMDDSPETDGSWVVWQAEPSGEHDSEIFLYDGHSVRQLTHNEWDDVYPAISNHAIAWEGYDGHDWEIYVASPGAVVNVTNNSTGDGDPAIFSDDTGTWVAWRSDGRLHLAGRKPGATAFAAPRRLSDDPVQEHLDLGPRGVVWEVSTGFDPVFGRPTGAIVHGTFTGTVTQVFAGSARDQGFAQGGGRIAFPAVSSDTRQVEMLVATRDTTDPAAAITSPGDGAVLTGLSATIRGTAHDNLAVDRVEVDTGDGVWRTAVIESGAGTGSATWRFDWTLPGEVDAAHTLRARATDGAGNQAISTANPTVRVRTAEASDFTDVPSDHAYHDAIYGMRAAGIIEGYEVADGWEFRPQNNLWRAQFAKMICGTMEVAVSESMTSPFTDLGADVADNLYPHEYVAAAYENGFTHGTSDTRFSPYADITRAQVVTMLVRATLNLHPGVLEMPPAVYTGTLGLFDPTHGVPMRIAEYNGLLDGLLGFGPSWSPWAPATRGETAQLLWNLMGLY